MAGTPQRGSLPGLWQALPRGRRLLPADEVVNDFRRLNAQVDDCFRTGAVAPDCRQMVKPWRSNAA